MKWIQEEIDITVDLLQSGFTYDQIGKVIGRSRNSVRIKCGRIGNGFEKYKRVDVKECLNCADKIEKFGTKFCSRSCSASFNNKLRPKNINRPETNERVNSKKRDIYHERKQKSCLDDLDKLSKSEIKAIMESQQFWDSDTEFFHQWCLDYDVLLYWEDLHKQMKRQRVIGLIASSVVGASILVAFGAAVLSKF
jgi:hypothetical protein